MTNTRFASDWDQAYRPSYAKIRRTVVRHIQVHLYMTSDAIFKKKKLVDYATNAVPYNFDYAFVELFVER